MGEVPHHYLSQVLLNLEICDLEIAHFIEFVPGNSDNDYVLNVVEVRRDHRPARRVLAAGDVRRVDAVLFHLETRLV